jgi:sugar-specific transcriptional regulator TrmB
MDAIRILKQLGLSEKQSGVYLAMLELGESSMSLIAKKAGLKRPTTYLIIDELSVMGLCGEIEKGKKKLYSATHPKRIVEIAHFRSRQAESLLPQLLARQKNSDKPKIRMLEGIRGVETAYQEAFATFNNKDEMLWIGDTGALEKNFPEVLKLYDQVLKRLHNPRIRELVHGDETSRKWVEKMNKKRMKNWKAKYIGDKFLFGSTDQLIVGDKIMTFAIGKEIFVMIIESRDITMSQRGLFNFIWNQIN